MKPRPTTLTCVLILCVVALSHPASSFSQQQAPAPTAGLTYDLGFAPYGRALSAVLAVIEGAKESLVMACYDFTSRPIADALLVAQRRGVKVAVVADYKASLQRYSLIPYLARSGVPVRLDSHYAILHDKFIVTDGQDLELGSFNYTLAATTKNAECVLVLYQVPDIARPYFAEWQRLWDESR